MNKQKTFVETPSHTDTSIITAADAALRYIAATHGAEVPLEPFSAAVTAQALASALHPYKTPHGREADSKMVMAISTTQQQAEPVALIMCDGKSYDFMVTVEGQKRIPDTGEFVHLYAAQPPAVAVAVPDGYALVPIEPTKAMCEAGDKADADMLTVQLIYRAMIAAAQKGGA